MVLMFDIRQIIKIIPFIRLLLKIIYNTSFKNGNNKLLGSLSCQYICQCCDKVANSRLEKYHFLAVFT